MDDDSYIDNFVIHHRVEREFLTIIIHSSTYKNNLLVISYRTFRGFPGG